MSRLLRMLRVLAALVFGSVLLCVGMFIVDRPVAVRFAIAAWEMGYAWAFPLSEMPGPLEGPGPIHGNFSDEANDPLTRVVITIDDGGESFYRLMFPIVQKYRLPCTQFIPVMRLGEFNTMTRDQVRDVHEWGCRAESHSLTHPLHFSELPEEVIERELTKSRDALKEMLGYSSTVFATPEGDYNKLVLDLIKKAGYDAHVIGFGGEDRKINYGDHLNPYELTRFDVKNFHKADDVCDAVKRAEGKPELLIFVYHFSVRRDDPDAKKRISTFKNIKAYIPEPLTVFDDVFEEMMKCIARERDEGRVRVTSIPEALKFFRTLEAKVRAKEREAQERARRESFSPPPVPPNAIPVPSRDARVWQLKEGPTRGRDWDQVLRIMKPERSR